MVEVVAVAVVVEVAVAVSVAKKDPLAAAVTDNLGKEKSTRLTDFRLS